MSTDDLAPYVERVRSALVHKLCAEVAVGALAPELELAAGVPKMIERIAELEAALEFYADERIYNGRPSMVLGTREPAVVGDQGQRAREALEGKG